MHQPKANTHRLYVKMKEVRDLSIIEEAHKSEIRNTADYLRTKHKKLEFVNAIKIRELQDTTN